VPKLGFHDLRHTFASHLIGAGSDAVRASRQLGHARPSITLDIYAHEFDRARGLDDVRDSFRRRVRAEPNLTKPDMEAELRGLGAGRAISRAP
jgi:integrase